METVLVYDRSYHLIIATVVLFFIEMHAGQQLWSKQKKLPFADDIFKRIFLNIDILNSSRIIHMGPFDNM